MSNANPLELGMLSLINDEREAAGLEPLRLITTLNEAAENHSSWMLNVDVFSHAGENGSSPSDRMEDAGYLFEGQSLALENIGWQSARGEAGYEDDVAQVHAGLMASPGHRANILNPDAEDIGIGVEIGAYSGAGSDYEAVMVTQVFGSTDADLSAWVDPGTGDPVEEIVEEEDLVAEEEPVADDAPDEVVDDMAEDDEAADDEVVEEMPVEEDPVEDEVVMEDDTPESEMPVEDMNDEDMPDVTEVVADDDMAMDDDTPGDDMAEDVPTDLPDVGPPMGPGVPLPSDLTAFTVDLSEAFEFRQEGDQFIWETSEDKLVAAFMKAFEDWAGVADTTVAEDADIIDLMVDDMPDSRAELAFEDDNPDEWLLDSCA